MRPVPKSRTRLARSLAATALLAAVSWTLPAAADTMVIERPGYHARYLFEAEPHVLLGFVDPPGVAHGQGIGAGFRGTFKIIDNGFIPKINNSIGIGFGLDFARYGAKNCIAFDAMGRCVADDGVTDIWLPIVMQWNFYISRNWSVFGEPGVAIRIESYDGPESGASFDFLHMYVGGRFHFTDNITLTMRIGYPTFAAGVSFFL